MSNRAYCPECGSPVVYDLTCHTYPQGDRWVACLPCDSAISYSCVAESCAWAYTDGLNPGNPRAEANATRRPVFLEGWELNGPHGVRAHPGASLVGEVSL